MEYTASNTRLARNTLMLYGRTIFAMIISLYTSRVILSALGIENFGIYNVIGGLVAMFSVISGSLTNAISRYLTYELGRCEFERLKAIFSISINIQVVISGVIIVLGETIGLWFLCNMMNIPSERLNEAIIVLHCSLAAFVVNLISVPYNATIIAHEKMSAYAYISILDVCLKLGIVYLLYLLPWDSLVMYSVLLLLESIIIRFIYGWYCNKNFPETKYKFVYDKSLVKELSNFAGWSFFANSAYMFNTQGINILMNVFWGVTVNAARGIALQVETALVKFSADFTTAINPQIIKSYAAQNLSQVYSLVNIGSKFSYFLILIVALPVLVETEYILGLWLGNAPEETALFVRLAIVGAMIERLGQTGYTACMATGKIKKYTLWISSVGCLVFPITYVAFKLDAPVETAYVIFIVIYIIVDGVRLWLMKKLLSFPVMSFIREVLAKLVLTTIITIIFPIFVVETLEPSLLRLCLSIIVCILSSVVAIYMFGMTSDERRKCLIKVKQYIKH